MTPTETALLVKTLSARLSQNQPLYVFIPIEFLPINFKCAADIIETQYQQRAF